jgi:acyl-CoA synthetase (AMP-forming)/AMP-acid ligase II
MELETRPRDLHVAASFLANAARGQDDIFLRLVAPGGAKDYSYAEISDLSRAYNAHFRSANLPEGSVLAIILTHGVELYAAFLGAMMAGLVPTILPFPTPKQDPQRYWSSHVELFALSQVRCLFTYDALLADARTHFGPGLAHISTSVDVDLGARSFEIAPTDLALLQHSSGTTALKKGVMLSHRAIHAQVESYARTTGLERGSRIVSWLPLYHDMGLVACFLMPMIVGCPVAHLDAFAWSARPTILLDEIVAFRGEYVWLPNFAYNHIVNNVRQTSRWDLSSVRAIIDCSEPCKPATFERFLKTPQFAGLKAEALQVCYAMAENVFAVSQTRMGETPRVLAVTAQSLRDGRRIVEAPPGDESAVRLLSCGRTIEGVEARIVGSQGEVLADEGELGEVAVSGASLYSGYHRRPEVTARRLVDGWHGTGDLGFLLAGELYITGRIDDLLIVHGKNIYAHEVEMAVNDLGLAIPGRVVAFAAANAGLGTDDLIVLCEIAAGVEGPPVKRAVREAVDATFGVTAAFVGALTPGTLVKTTSGKISRHDNKVLYERTRDAQ